jgi:hypothetical protein
MLNESIQNYSLVLYVLPVFLIPYNQNSNRFSSDLSLNSIAIYLLIS